MSLPSIVDRIAAELGVSPRQVAAAVALLDEGATVPFIARYRKEATGGLSDVQLRALAERLGYLRELEQRRAAVLASIQQQGLLTPQLQAAIEAAATRQALEDLYLPYRPKRRTKAQIAREAGLEPLALGLLAEPQRDPQAEAAAYVDAGKGVPDVKAALEGARQILMERFAEDAALVGRLRDYLQQQGVLVSQVVEGQEAAGQKYRDYFTYAEPWRTIPSHRALALLRGRREGVLRLSLKQPEELLPDWDAARQTTAEGMIAAHAGICDHGRPADAWLKESVRWAWRVKLSLHLELDLFNSLFERAEAEAIRVFAANLKDLLMAAPAGAQPVIGLDPGIRTGVKVACVDSTGRLLETATLYPFAPRNDRAGALAELERMARRHGVRLIAIGNGTASRETERLVRELAQAHPELKLTPVLVNEAGASVYSASELAAREFPELDVSLRGAVSIARRLQDPLAELVKIDPKSIGVGQYQHDVSEAKLAQVLDAVVEDCVNAVGVEVNTASVPLLARVSGLNRALAEAIVAHRDAHGPFRSREALKAVPRLGPKTFELAAGFLRIRDGDEPLDASAVHPEAYAVVQRILADLQRDVRTLIGDTATLRRLDPARYTDERFGLPTVRDILGELEKPGRDPRPQFRTPIYQDGVEALQDLKPGMVLEGVVTNVANFGAFVDVGVHQDGLVHVSELAEGFVRDPRAVVRVGEIVRVRVLEVDVARRRIALSMRLQAAGGGEPGRPAARSGVTGRTPRREAQPLGAMAAALARALADRR
ncbi:MAG: RNA-binding transcriptional accessory protein [Thiobacillaceae bacterium]|nr:RNA-binding transcriptional accessory protein [Thiobacillaceae bacterium]MDW8322930.1 Tex family protein [Burkholderiales bacterium]